MSKNIKYIYLSFINFLTSIFNYYVFYFLPVILISILLYYLNSLAVREISEVFKNNSDAICL